jgi:hypothetical protein
MWILHFLPDSFILWFCNILLVAGVVLTVAGFFIQRIPFPLLWQYQLLFKIIGVLLLVAGVYFRGGYGVEMAWRERVTEVEAKLKIAEEQSVAANTEIQTKTRETIKYIRGRTEVVREYVDREVVKYDTKFMPGGICEIPREFVKAHNDAAEGPKK